MENQSNSTNVSVQSNESITPLAENLNQVVNKEQSTKPDDLISRATRVTLTPEPKKDQPVDIEFDFKEIERIQDPTAKAWAMDAYKSMQRGVSLKLQKNNEELIALRKSLEEQRKNEIRNKKWTAERIQNELLNDPEFVREAQQLANLNVGQGNPGGYSEEEWSNFSPQEKARINLLEQKVANIEKSTVQSMVRQQNALEDSQLTSKYANYNPQQIDIITQDMLEGRVRATREHIYKAFYHDDNVKKAYELGRQDALRDNNEKIESISNYGYTNNSTPEDRIDAQKGESDQNLWNRIIAKNLVKAKQQEMVR